MWICNRCQHHNREGDVQCIECAAPRHARRFGAGTEVETPSVEQPAERVAPTPAQPAAAEPHAPAGRAPRVDLTPPSRVVRCAAGRALRVAGLVLLVLLPGLTALIAITHVQAWAQPLAQWLLGAAQPLPEAAGMALYIVVSVAALLVSALPGLFAVGLGQLLIRLTPPELVRP